MSNLIDESPGHSDAFFDVANDAVGRLEAGIIVKCRPNLGADLLFQQKNKNGLQPTKRTRNTSILKR